MFSQFSIQLTMQYSKQAFSQSILQGQKFLKKSDVQMTQKILQVNPQMINAFGQSQEHPFFSIDIHEDIKCRAFLQIFYKYGVNLNILDKQKRTVVFKLFKQGKMQSIYFLESLALSGFLPPALSLRDKINKSPLFLAVDNNQIELVSRLELTSEDVNLTDSLLGQPPLFYAAKNSNNQMCMLLLSKGANPCIVDKCSQTVLDYVDLVYNQQLYLILKKAMSQWNKLRLEKSKNLVYQNAENQKMQAYRLRALTKQGNIVSIGEQGRQIIEAGRAKMNETSNFELKGGQWHLIALKVILKLQRQLIAGNFKDSQRSNKQQEKVIDLNQIKLKLQHKMYNRFQQLSEDVRSLQRIYRQKYNDKHHLSQQAKKLVQLFFDLATQNGLI